MNDRVAFEKALVAFYKQADQIFVYGSDAAYGINTQLTGLFERISAPNRAVAMIADINDAAHAAMDADEAAINSQITRFQLLFCSDVSPTPRDGCK